ncbi:MAG: methylated-DNA--[protein]-cysteine S-methyltransferase [Fidelibacterota bacterium]
MKRKIYYTVIENDLLGEVLIASTAYGLCAVEFGDLSVQTILNRLIWKNPECDFQKDPLKLEEAAEEIKEYLNGKRRKFTLALDLKNLTAFQSKTLDETMKIPYGKTESYREVAGRIGVPRGARAVGNALAVNPIPIVVPCHRVISSNGELGGYSTGIEYKRRLLDLETHHR